MNLPRDVKEARSRMLALLPNETWQRLEVMPGTTRCWWCNRALERGQGSPTGVVAWLCIEREVVECSTCWNARELNRLERERIERRQALEAARRQRAAAQGVSISWRTDR